MPVNAESDLAALAARVRAALPDRPGDALDAVRNSDPDLPRLTGPAFRALVTELPPELWRSDPIVAVKLADSYRASCCPSVRPGLGYLRIADLAVERGDADPIARIELSIAKATTMRELGRLDEAAVELDHTRQLSAHLAPDRLDLEVRRTLQRGVLDVLLGRVRPARAHLEYAVGLQHELASIGDRVEATGALALVTYDDLRLDAAERSASAALALAAEHGLADSSVVAPALTARVFVAVERLDLDVARELEPAALETAAGSAWLPLALSVSALLHQVLGDPATALDRVEELRAVGGGRRPPGVAPRIGDLVRASALYALGRAEEAWELVRDMPPGDRHELCPARLVARYRLGRGDLHGAEQALEACERIEGHSARTLADVRLLQAAIWFGTGDLSASDLAFDQSLATMARTGMRVALTGIPAGTLHRLVTRALQRPHGDAAHGVLRELHPASAPEAGVEPLTPAERRVLAALLTRTTVAEMASALYLSPNTVKTHLRNLYRKLGVDNRQDAIRAARGLGIDTRLTP